MHGGVRPGGDGGCLGAAHDRKLLELGRQCEQARRFGDFPRDVPQQL